MKLSDYRGKIVVLDFWGDRLDVCKARRSLAKRLKDQPFAIVGITTDHERAKIRQACEDNGISWRSFWDDGSSRGPIGTKWNVHSWPNNFILDEKGVIRFRNVHRNAMDRTVDSLLAKIQKVPRPR